jgi:hypothetical protein
MRAGTIFRRLFLLTLMTIFLQAAVAGQELPDINQPPKPIPKPKPQPRSGILLVITNPATADLIVKNSRGVEVTNGKRAGSRYRAELPPGEYSIMVTSANHNPFVGKASVKAGREEIVDVELTPTIGSIMIGPVEADADLLIDGQKPVGISFKREENQIKIDGVATGIHTLRITHPTIVDWEEKIEVKGGEATNVTPKFKPAIVYLVVESEPGAQVYVDNIYKSRIPETGKSGIIELQPGPHTIKATKDEYVSSEQTGAFSAGNTLVELKLTRVAFSPEFTDYFMDGTKFWTAKEWRAESGKMVVQGPGIGLLRDKLYKDFKMEIDVKFANGKGAVWILRAQDEQNYYIFQLSGPKGASPKTFRSYICQNGTLNLIKTDFVAEDLSRPNDSFHIVIEAKGSTIKHFIQASRAPKAEGPQPLSIISDKTFSYGAVGFGTIDNEEAIVQLVSIVPTN